MSETVTMIDINGKAVDVAAEDVQRALDAGLTVEGDDARVNRVADEAVEAHYTNAPGKLVAGVAGAARGVSLGGSDVALGLLGGEEGRRDLQQFRDQNPGISTATEIGGSIVAALPSGGTSLLARTPAGLASKLGTKLATTSEGASVAAKIGQAALGYGVEGAIVGTGQGVSELALSKDPLTIERIASTLSSHALYGGAVGAGAGTIAKTAEIGLGRARTAIENFRSGREALETLDDDLARMDPKQLVAARKAEVEMIKAAQAAEVETLAAARATERRAFADELSAFRREMKEQAHALTTKDIRLPAVEGKWATAEIGKVASQTDKQLDKLLNNPIALADNPSRARMAMDALQQQENAYTKLLERSDELRAVYGADTLGLKRAAALDTIPAALEKNRALQQKLAGLNAPIRPTIPDVSPRLQAIDEAREVLSTVGRGEKSIAEQMLAGSIFSGAAGMTAMVPGVGPMLAPFVGAKASRLITEQVFGRLGKATGDAVQRNAKALDRFLDVGQRVARTAPPVATRVLNSVRYAPGEDPPRRQSLADAFKARSEEIRSQVAVGPDGKFEVRPESREMIADHLLPIRAADPVVADQIETIAARKLTFLASKLPKRPDVAGFKMGGRDLWQPSDFEMRTFARYAAAAENPIGVFERMADGFVTPEDAETIREVYPEMLADVTAKVVTEIPNLRKALPYKRRLAMSILTGVPVDPAMDPKILRVLQQSFELEEGTSGGTEAPRAKPQFGSVRAESPTPAQERAS